MADNISLEEVLKKYPDPLEIPLAIINALHKSNESYLSLLYDKVYKEHKEIINNIFDEDSNVSDIALYKEGGEVKLEKIAIGKDFLSVRKKLEEKLSKHAYLFSRPTYSEESAYTSMAETK